MMEPKSQGVTIRIRVCVCVCVCVCEGSLEG